MGNGAISRSANAQRTEKQRHKTESKRQASAHLDFKNRKLTTKQTKSSAESGQELEPERMTVSPVSASLRHKMRRKGELFEPECPGFTRVNFKHAFVKENPASEQKASSILLEARKLRKKWLYRQTIPDYKRRMDKAAKCMMSGPDGTGSKKSAKLLFHMHADGVMRVSGITPALPYKEFKRDYRRLITIVTNGEARTFSHKRLSVLSHSFALHRELNGHMEEIWSKDACTDFYKIPKVDTHVHLAAGFSAKQFTDFIKTKFRDCGSDVVDMKTGQTLADVAKKMNLDIERMNVDQIDVQADATVFDRFDRFNAKYNPAGNSALRKIFLKSNNSMGGRYFAELTQQLLTHLEHERAGVCFAEYRVSIYGSTATQWAELAQWMWQYKLFSNHNRWVVQVPRIYRVFKKIGMVNSFQDILNNFFTPLFAATADPEANPALSHFLANISGFDSVDDESLFEASQNEDETPSQWTSESSPSYAYQLYYFWANLTVLNRFRESKGLNTFQLRPHCGEAGLVLHLAVAYLLAHGISHGIRLQDSIALQYLYYVDQIGIAVSPISNNFLFLRFRESPFRKFFVRGLNVSLSSDDPLLFHMSDNPLLEEYAIARNIWQLSSPDMCEISRNSVIQSGFTDAEKAEWLGKKYHLNLFENADVDLDRLVEAYYPDKTNVPMVRALYRCERLAIEHRLLERNAS